MKNRRKSVLTLFITVTSIVFLIVVMFNSIVIQHLNRQYFSLTQSQLILKLSKQLFEVVSSNGYERGRVNVVMNYRGNPDEMHKSIQFISKKRQMGHQLLEKTLQEIKQSRLNYDEEIVNQILESQQKSIKLQTIYQGQFKISFAERDLTIDDIWFNHMSNNIDLITLLIYSLKENNSIEKEVKSYIDMIYVLSMLRNHSGPVVSYMKATTFNRDSLTVSRMQELVWRKLMVKNLVNRLKIIGATRLDTSIMIKIHGFDAFYQNEVLTAASFIAENKNVRFNTPVDFRAYLKNGVKALEKLKELTLDIIDSLDKSYQQKLFETKVRLIVTLIISIVIIILIAFNIFNLYKTVYKRLISASKIIKELSNNKTEVDIMPPHANDELGDVEKGLSNFQNNLIALHERNQQLKKLSTQDSLTHLLNHENILEHLEIAHKDTLRYGNTYSVLMVDIDWFKKVNDTYGHQVGDEVILEFSTLLHQSLRDTDKVGRYGGEEFLIILTRTSESKAVEIAEKLQQKINSTLFSSKKLNLTSSIGIASFSSKLTIHEIVKNSDVALYNAKSAGRNCIKCI